MNYSMGQDLDEPVGIGTVLVAAAAIGVVYKMLTGGGDSSDSSDDGRPIYPEDQHREY